MRPSGRKKVMLRPEGPKAVRLAVQAPRLAKPKRDMSAISSSTSEMARLVGRLAPGCRLTVSCREDLVCDLTTGSGRVSSLLRRYLY